MSSELLAAVGRSIRAAREAAGLTQARLGSRSGIEGKYVSEIERGTRNLPLNTLHSIVKKGLGLDLQIQFGEGKAGTPPLPAAIESVARAIQALPAKQQRTVLSIIEMLLSLSKR